MEPDAALRRVPALITNQPGIEERPYAARPQSWPELHTQEFNARVRDRALAWLDSRGRDAASLIAVWDLIEDPFILQEAANKFPHDPAVCMAMIENNRHDITDSLYWIQQLATGESENPEGHNLKVWALYNSGDHAGAFAALRENEHGIFHRNNYFDGRAKALTEAALACGIPAREAALLPVSLCRETQLTPLFLSSMESVLVQEMDAAQAAGDVDRQSDNARAAGAVLAEFVGENARTIVEDEAVMSLWRAVKPYLPEDRIQQPDGTSAGEQRRSPMFPPPRLITVEEIEENARQVRLYLQSATDAVVIEYGHRFVKDGERTANQWLLEQTAPGQNPSPPQ